MGLEKSSSSSVQSKRAFEDLKSAFKL